MFGNEEVERTILSRKWLRLNEEIGYRRIINCTNAAELRNAGNYVYKIRFEWENKIRNLLFELGRRE
jgi:hypothetical protein